MTLSVGDRVKLTPAGLSRLGGGRKRVPYDENLRGTVTGIRGHSPGDWRYVQVRRDGIKTPECYFVGFWEKG